MPWNGHFTEKNLHRTIRSIGYRHSVLLRHPTEITSIIIIKMLIHKIKESAYEMGSKRTIPQDKSPRKKPKY